MLSEQKNPLKSIKSNTNNNQYPKNKDQNWLKYKLDDNWFFGRTNVKIKTKREERERKRGRKINCSPPIVVSACHEPTTFYF